VGLHVDFFEYQELLIKMVKMKKLIFLDFRAGTWISVLWILLVAGSGCRAAPQPALPIVERNGDEIRYNGRITEEGKTAFIIALELNPVSGVRITSTGGDALVALQMGELIRAQKLSVTVERFCISACAQYIFVAGAKKRLEPGALLIFHSSPSAMEAVLRNSPLSHAAPRFAAGARAERQFYQSLGIRLDLAGLSSVLVPICVVELRNRPTADLYRYGVAWQFEGFVPTREQLAAVGIDNVEGTFPTAATLGQQLRAAGFRAEYKPLLAPPIPLQNLSPPSAKVPLCPPSVVDARTSA
jgi:hypothetical protein